MEFDILGVDHAKHVFQLKGPIASDGPYIGQGFRVARWLNACVRSGQG